MAYVIHPGAVYHAPSVFELADGIWHARRDQAHALLRGRVHTTQTASVFDRAVVKVCGRRLRDAVVPLEGPLPPAALHDMLEAAKASSAHHKALCDVPASNDEPLKFRDRDVVAQLFDRDGVLLETARNTNGTHRLRHAEVNLVQRWQAAGHTQLPPNARVEVSLQCCRMCAALLVQVASDGLLVRYAEPEPGPMGHATELQRLGWERQS